MDRIVIEGVAVIKSGKYSSKTAREFINCYFYSDPYLGFDGNNSMTSSDCSYTYVRKDKYRPFDGNYGEFDIVSHYWCGDDKLKFEIHLTGERLFIPATSITDDIMHKITSEKKLLQSLSYSVRVETGDE